jgi:AcrR family transcriptional regulator
MPDKKQLKANRMKSYFVAAAKAIIETQGVENLSVRQVADQAGYSYATIYNYYKDVDSLLWEVKKSFSVDLMHSIAETMENDAGSDIRSAFQAYVAFFMEKPNLFRFFFQWPIAAESEHAQEALKTFGRIFSTSSASFPDQVNETAVFKLCLYAVHGLLLLFHSANGMSTQEFWDDFHTSLQLILKS